MPGPAGPSPKLLGRLLAVLMALVFAGVIWWAISNAAPTAPTGPAPIDSRPPDITDIETGESIVLTMVDKDDPTRVTSVIEADRLDPVGEGERVLTNPRAWLYPKGGRVVRVTADRARLMMRANESPESGTLEGSVRMRVYEAAADGRTNPADDAEPIVTATFDQPVRFERRYMRLSTPGGFVIDSDQVRFAGEDLTLMLNEVRGRLERLDVQRGGSMQFRVGPGRDDDADTAAAPIPEAVPASPSTATTPTAGPGASLPAQPAPEPDEPQINLYHTVLSDAVIATLGTARVNADRLDLFTRLTDNALPESAIARVGFVRTPRPEPSQPEPSGDPVPFGPPHPEEPVMDTMAEAVATESTATEPVTTAEAAIAETDPVETDPAEPLVLTWTGPMTVRPIEPDAPAPELDADDAALALHADPGNRVRLADEAAGITGDAATLHYFATRGLLTLDAHAPETSAEAAPTEAAIAAVQTDTDSASAASTAAPSVPAESPEPTTNPDPVRIAIAGAGQGQFASVRADLLRGLIDLEGPGRGVTTRDTASSTSEASIRWTDTARLTLVTTPDGQLTDRLTAADFFGDIEASQDRGLIQADILQTAFEPGPDGASAIRIATITRGSVASVDPVERARLVGPARPGGSLAADTIRMGFTPPTAAGEGPEPARVEATGAVMARSGTSTLEADYAAADLARDFRNEITVRTADALGSVLYRDTADATAAAGDAMALNAENETIRLTGPEASITRGDSVMSGPVIDLDARRRRMEVTGAGRFDHTLRNADALPAGKILARWTDSMRFDDALGRLNAQGDVSVISTPDPYTRDTLAAHRVEVEITPQPVSDSIGGRGPVERELRVARAYGGADADTPSPATIETRRYDPADPERVTGLMYLEGDQIVADSVASLLRVPGAGVLLVLDRRAEVQPPAPDDQTTDATNSAPRTDPLGGSVGPGLTRFTWAGSMELDRAAGVAVMDQDVVVRHKTLAESNNGGQIAELQTDLLTAAFAETAADGDAVNAEGEESPFILRTADARGSVVFRASGKELLADGARYEATTDILHALASPGRMVELREPGRVAPLSARAIMWNLARDRIEINRPSPVTLPN